jgi:hypothetical protein
MQLCRAEGLTGSIRVRLQNARPVLCSLKQQISRNNDGSLTFTSMLPHRLDDSDIQFTDDAEVAIVCFNTVGEPSRSFRT